MWIIGGAQSVMGKFWGALVESNMAAKLFLENPPSDQISQFFGEKSEEYMSCTEKGTELRDISCFFAEFEAAVGVIEEKLTFRGRNPDLQKLIPIQGMVKRTLKKLHEKVIRRLRSKPTLATQCMERRFHYGHFLRSFWFDLP